MQIGEEEIIFPNAKYISIPKSNRSMVFLVPCSLYSLPSQKFREHSFTTFWVILLTDRQTNKQTNISSLSEVKYRQLKSFAVEIKIKLHYLYLVLKQSISHACLDNANCRSHGNRRQWVVVSMHSKHKVATMYRSLMMAETIYDFASVQWTVYSLLLWSLVAFVNIIVISCFR